MAWLIEFDEGASKDLKKLDPQVARRIVSFLRDRLAPMDDPRSIGEALRGSKLGEFWKYRVGDYRVIADIEDKVIRIEVVAIGNRRDLYKRLKDRF